MARKLFYELTDIDSNMVRFAEAYIKRVITCSKKNYYRRLLKERNKGISFEEYNDNSLYLIANKADLSVHNIISIDEVSIWFESEDIYNAIMKLSPKQRTVLLKSCVLKIPMEEIAGQMGICISKVYKHKRNALNIIRNELKEDERYL